MRSSGRPPIAWRMARSMVVAILARAFGWRVAARGPARLPRPDEPLVVVFNHTSNVDAFLVAHVVWALSGRWCRPLAKAELFRHRLIGPVARRSGAIPVERGIHAGRTTAFSEAVEALRDGHTVMVAPEATISHDGRILPLRYGAARLALDAGARVLVVTHLGAQRAWSPVVRGAQRDVVVTMRLDLLEPSPRERPAALTERIAATMLARLEELQAAYPQAEPSAPWWPPYHRPARPTAIARESLQRYQDGMARAVEQARALLDSGRVAGLPRPFTRSGADDGRS